MTDDHDPTPRPGDDATDAPDARALPDLARALAALEPQAVPGAEPAHPVGDATDRVVDAAARERMAEIRAGDARPDPTEPARAAESMTRRGPGGRPAARLFRLPAAAVAAIAAALLVAVVPVAWWNLRAPRGERPHGDDRPPVTEAGDVRDDARDLNGDGTVDVLDAMTLALRVEGRADGPVPDLNDDGRRDRADARALALLAVRRGAER